MSAQHTPRLLTVNPIQLDQIATSDGKFEVARATVLNPVAHTIGNARRLVACWNACEDEDTSMLEAIVREGTTVRKRHNEALSRAEQYQRELCEVESQRDALLAAARTMFAALDDLIAKKPMLAAAMAGSTTMGNQRVEFCAVIKKVEAAL